MFKWFNTYTLSNISTTPPCKSAQHWYTQQNVHTSCGCFNNTLTSPGCKWQQCGVLYTDKRGLNRLNWPYTIRHKYSELYVIRLMLDSLQVVETNSSHLTWFGREHATGISMRSATSSPSSPEYTPRTLTLGTIWAVTRNESRAEVVPSRSNSYVCCWILPWLITYIWRITTDELWAGHKICLVDISYRMSYCIK